MNEIVKLVREQFPDDRRSEGVLTLEMGRWARENRPEWFEQFPEFARQYSDIERTLRPSLGEEFGGAFGAAVDNLQATTFGAGAMAADLIGADRARAYLAERAVEQEAEAAEYRPSVGSYKDVDSLADAAYYAAFGLGTATPSMLESAATGLAGAAIGSAANPGGGTIAGGIAGLVAKQAMRNLIKAEVRDLTTEVGKAALKKETKALAARYLGQAGMLATSIPQAQGEIYNSISDTEDGAAIAAGLGTLSGLLDVIPESYIFGRFFKPGTKVAREEAGRVKRYLKELGTEAAKTMPMEGTTEAAQEFINFAAEKWARGEPPVITDADIERFTNAGIIGMMAGGVMSPISALGGGRQMQVGTPDQATQGEAANQPAAHDPVLARRISEAEALAGLGEGQDTVGAFTPFDEFVGRANMVDMPPSPARASAEVIEQGLDAEENLRQSPAGRDRLRSQLFAERVQSDALTGIGQGEDISGVQTPVDDYMAQMQAAIQAAAEADRMLAESRSPARAPAEVFEEALTDEERLRRSPRGLELLRNDLTQRATPVTQPVSTHSIAPRIQTIAEQSPVAPTSIPELHQEIQVADAEALPTVPVANLDTDLNGLSHIIDFRGTPLTDEARLDIVRRVSDRNARSSSGGALILDRATGKVHLKPTSYQKNDIVASYVRKNRGRGVQIDLDEAVSGGKLREIFKVTLPDGARRYELIGATNFRTPDVAQAMVLGDIETFAASPQIGVLISEGDKVKIRGDSAQGSKTISLDALGANAPADVAGDYTGQRTRSLADISTDSAEVAGGEVSPAVEQLSLAERLPADAQAIVLEAADAIAANASEVAVRNGIIKALADRNITAKSVSKLAAMHGTTFEDMVDRILGLAEIAAEDINRTVRAPNSLRMLEGERLAMFDRLVQAIRDSGGEVVAFSESLMAELAGWSQAQGFQLSQADGRSLIGIGLQAAQHRDDDAVVALIHETAHHFLEKLLPDPTLRLRFQAALDRLPWGSQRWLLNPFSTDLRLLANADPASLSPEQRRMVEALSPADIDRLRATNPETLLVEQAAEHLAMLGIEKGNARSLLQQIIRAVKDILIRIGMAVQRTLKGPDAVSDSLVRQYVENRWLQFINRDFAYSPQALGSLRAYIGAPATYRERITGYMNVGGGDPRVGEIDIKTGQWYPTDFMPSNAAEVADKVLAFTRAAEIAARDGASFTVRSRLRQGITSHSPDIAYNKEYAGINFVAETLERLWSRLRTIAPASILEQEAENPEGARNAFMRQYMGVTPSASPYAMRGALDEELKRSPVPGANPATQIRDLKPATEQATDIDGAIRNLEYADAQQYAMDFAVDSLRRLQKRLHNKLDKATKELEKLKKRENPNAATATRIRELDRDAAIIRRVIEEPEVGLRWQAGQLEVKRGIMDTLDVFYPGAAYRVPVGDGDAPESFKSFTLPKDLRFTDTGKRKFIAHLAAMRKWLDNTDNFKYGADYNRALHAWKRLHEHFSTEYVYTPVTFTLRKSATKSIVDALRQIGLPGATHLSRLVNHVQAKVTRHAENSRILGAQWSEAYLKFAESMGQTTSELFRETVWSEIERAFEQVSAGTTGALEVARKALREQHGIKIDSQKSKDAFAHLIRMTRTVEAWRRQVAQQYGLKVDDPTMGGIMRNLRDIGYLNGSRTVSRSLESLYRQMDPVWSYTGETKDEQAEARAKQLKAMQDPDLRNLFFDDYVRDGFVTPLIESDVEFIKFTDEDGDAGRARQEDVRAAWATANGDMLAFARELHRISGRDVDVSQTIDDVMGSFLAMFNQVKGEMVKRDKVESNGMEVMPRQMMDARVSDNWPAQWVSYSIYDTTSNYTFVMQAALNSVFGPNGFGSGSEFDQTLRELRLTLNGLVEEEQRLRKQGLDNKAIRKQMGDARYTIARQANDHLFMLNKLRTSMEGITRTTGYQLGDMRKIAELFNLQAALMLQQPKSFLVNFTDMFAAFYTTKFSKVTLASLGHSIRSVFSGGADSIGASLGKEFGLNSELASRRNRSGLKDPDNYITFKQKMADASVRFGEPERPEGVIERAGRATSVGIRAVREVINLGTNDVMPNLAPKALSPKFRPFGIFSWGSKLITDALIDGLYHSINDLALRGVEAIDRAGGEAYVRQLESGNVRLDPETLGYARSYLILNDKAAYDWLADALVTKMGERSVEDFVAKAWRRRQQAQGDKWEAIDNDQFIHVANIATNELSMQANFASTPLTLLNSPLGRVFSTFLVWPWNAMQRGFKAFRTPEHEITFESMIDGLTLVFMGAIPAALAASLAVDFYDEKIVGKKSNLRDISASAVIPGVGLLTNEPMAILERLARYGTFGILSEAVNGVLNFEDARGGFTADSRIFVFSQLNSLRNIIGNLYQQEGEMTYQTVGRPLLQFIGMNGVLQYTQIASNLADWDNAERMVNERINASNYLRASGRALDLDVRVFQGTGSIPTPITPYIRQMELAAISDNPALFRDAYARALQMAAKMGKADNVDDLKKYIRESFGSRHPLRRVFRTLPSDQEYRAILSSLNETGRDAVARSVTSYNRYLERLGARPVIGREGARSTPAASQTLHRRPMSIEEARALAAQAAWQSGF